MVHVFISKLKEFCANQIIVNIQQSQN